MRNILFAVALLISGPALAQSIGPGYVPPTYLLSASNTWTARQTINLNTALTLPTSGSTPVLQLSNVDGTSTKIQLSAFGAGSPSIAGLRAEGTMATPTATLQNDTLMAVQGGGYANGAYAGSKAAMNFLAFNNWSASDNSTWVTFNLTPSGSATAATALEILNTGLVVQNTGGFLLTFLNSLTNGAAAATGTLTNAPTAGNPTKWIPINDNGTTRYIPAW